MTTPNLFNIPGSALATSAPASPAPVPTPAPQPAPAPVPEPAPLEAEGDGAGPAPETELSMLKKRASLMGITFSNNISVETLRARIQAKLDGDAESEANGSNEPEEDNEGFVTEIVEAPVQEEAPAVYAAVPPVSPIAPVPPVGVVQVAAGAEAPVEPPVPMSAKMSLRQKIMSEQMALVRVRITNLDPKKKDLPGEIFTVANEYLGTVKKFIPYGEVTDSGYHIPLCLYNQLKERTFVSIKTRKGTRGTVLIESQDAREFSLEVLPQLDVNDLARLAASQAAAAGE